MEPDGPEEWHVARVVDGGFLDSDEDDEDDEEPWWDGVANGAGDGGDGRGGSVRRAIFGGNSPRLTAVVALTAALLGVVAGLALVRFPSAGPSSAAPGASATPGPDQNGGGSSGGLPAPSPLQGNGSGALELQLIGTVTAVNTTSITVGGNGGSVTARFTAATKFSGQVRSPAGIKDGDQVAVAATGTPSNLTVASIQDPASGSGL